MAQKLYKPVIVRKEVDDEHYYFVDGKFFPSVTRILSETLPTPFALKQWLGDLGNEKAEQKLNDAAKVGTNIHNACEKLLNGEQVNLFLDFPVKSQKKMLVGFVNWFSEYQPKLIKGMKTEMTLASSYGYAGTLDIPVMINDEPTIVDIKTSRSVYDSHKLQLVAYQNAFEEMFGIKPKIAILHLTPLTKKGYSFHDESKMEIGGKPVDINDFLAVMNLYKVLNGGKIPEPPMEDAYPEILKLEHLVAQEE